MIRVFDLAYVRFGAPDLDGMARFVQDFGLAISLRTPDRLFARGTDPAPYVHVTERGEPGFRGLAFEVATPGELAAAAALPGASAIEKLDAPGGGQCVRFRDPDGYLVEVVHGRAAPSPLPVPRPGPVNRGSERLRLGTRQEIPRGPAAVKRVGHAVLIVRDFAESVDWYRSRFGLMPSDEIYLGDAENRVAAFLRCDRGEAYTDHHTLVCVGLGEPGLDHVAFEVEDFDAVMTGHEHLSAAGYGHKMGPGRHVLGSQVYDYWHDPFGHVLEHFTDGDLLNARSPGGIHDPGAALGSHWGTLAT